MEKLVKKSSAFYVTRKFVTVFTTARHRAKWIQSTFPHPISLSSILILSFRVVPPSGFSNQSIACISQLSHACYMPRPCVCPFRNSITNILIDIKWQISVKIFMNTVPLDVTPSLYFAQSAWYGLTGGTSYPSVSQTNRHNKLQRPAMNGGDGDDDYNIW